MILACTNSLDRLAIIGAPGETARISAWRVACSNCDVVDASTFEPHIARALELQVGKARVVVELDQVVRIVETVCTPMPMTHPLVRGIAFEDGRPLVCVVLSGKPTEAEPRTVTVVRLAGAGPVAWALCADQVHGVVSLVARSTHHDGRWPRWLCRVRSDDGRTLARFDAAQMARDLGAAS
ncbi:MAG TPA: chemotaxis protein CheW [Kofleriaceae bacterium]|nr:chemotaxis protein CheW [Kofleriaceae bacterium]